MFFPLERRQSSPIDRRFSNGCRRIALEDDACVCGKRRSFTRRDEPPRVHCSKGATPAPRRVNVLWNGRCDRKRGPPRSEPTSRYAVKRRQPSIDARSALLSSQGGGPRMFFSPASAWNEFYRPRLFRPVSSLQFFFFSPRRGKKPPPTPSPTPKGGGL